MSSWLSRSSLRRMLASLLPRRRPVLQVRLTCRSRRAYLTSTCTAVLPAPATTPAPPPLPRAPTTLASLPLKILDRILFFVGPPLAKWDHFLLDYSSDGCQSNTERLRLESLCAASRVCRTWRVPAQRALWQEVVSYRNHGPEFAAMMGLRHLEYERYSRRRASGAFGRHGVRKLWVHLREGSQSPRLELEECLGLRHLIISEDGSDVDTMPWDILAAPSLAGEHYFGLA